MQKRYAKAEEQMNKEDAWTTDTNAKIILQKLGISELDKKSVLYQVVRKTS